MTTNASEGTPRPSPQLTVDDLTPKLEGTPVGELTSYRSLFVLDRIPESEAADGSNDDTTPDGTTTDGTTTADAGMLDPFAVSEDARFQHVPAVGVLLVHEQRWVQGRLALGNLLHSVCLAPGEVTKVAVIDWQRRTAGTSTDTSQQAEAVTSSIDQARAVNEVQRAVAQEAQSGGSRASAASETVEAGMASSALVVSSSVSAATSATEAVTAQFSLGSRDLAAESTNRLSQRTAETSQALRSRRSAAVQEVSEREAESMSSRVLVNYNRRHALNIEYFEVLQLYGIETRLASWDRCLFIPLKPVDFTDEAIRAKHRANLVAGLRARGKDDLAERLVLEDPEKQTQLKAEIDALTRDIKATTERTATYTTELGPYGMALQGASNYLVMRQSPTAKGAADGALSVYRANKPDDPAFPNEPTTEVVDRLAEGLRTRQAALDEARWSLPALQRRLDVARKRLADLVLPVGETLLADQLALSQDLWLRLEPFDVYRMLQGYKVGGESVSALVDPRPVGVFGNYLAFRWGFPPPSETGDEAKDPRKDFEDKYLKGTETTEKGDADGKITAEVALPTSGIFAEAVLGRGEAAETIDDTRLWRWDLAPIPILPPDLDQLGMKARGGRQLDLSGRDFASALAALRSESPGDISHIGGILDAVRDGNMFRDMGGLAQAVSLADKVAALSGSAASDAGKRAEEIHSKVLDTFVDILNSDVGKAAVAEFMLPGAGAAVLGAGGGAKGSDPFGGEDAEAKKLPEKPASTAPPVDQLEPLS